MFQLVPIIQIMTNYVYISVKMSAGFVQLM